MLRFTFARSILGVSKLEEHEHQLSNQTIKLGSSGFEVIFRQPISGWSGNSKTPDFTVHFAKYMNHTKL